MVSFSPPTHVRRNQAVVTVDAATTRTSESHPMNVSWVAKSEAGGRFGLTFCPGKTVNRGGVYWRRSLDMDLERLKTDFGVTTILCLLGRAELASLQLRHYENGVQAKGLHLLTFPIVEMQAPDSIKTTAKFIDTVISKLNEGEVMIIHCRGGVGRAGLIASCLLLELKMAVTSIDAIAKVRKLRCRSAVESYCQEQFIAKYANFIRAKSEPILHDEKETAWKLFQKKTLVKSKVLSNKQPSIVKASCDE